MNKKIKVRSPKSIKSLPLHQHIIDKVLSLSVKYFILTEQTKNILFKLGKDDECYSNITKNDINLVILEYKIKNKSYLSYRQPSDNFGLYFIESLGFNCKAEYTEYGDAYGSAYWLDTDKNICCILNNYDHDFITDNGSFYDNNSLEFINVLGFATIFNDVIRFTQIVYSLKYQRLIVRDDVCYKLPFSLTKRTFNYFGGKRAVYRQHSVLSIKTCMNVYKKVDKQYHQDKSLKDTLSYPRLLLF